MRTKSVRAEPVRPERSFAQLCNEVDPVADMNYLSGFVDGVLFVTDLDYDADLSAVVRATRRPRAEGRHELLAAVATWIRARMAGRTASEIVDVEIPMKRSSSTKSPGPVARIEPGPAGPVEKDTTAVNEMLQRISGCSSPELSRLFLSQARYGHAAQRSPEDRTQQQREILSFVEGVAPKDVMESALAAQMCSLHNLGMRELLRASRETDEEAAGVHMGRAQRLIAAYQRCVEALDRHRGRGKPQVVRVERVTVNAGGQAIVGAVSTPG